MVAGQQCNFSARGSAPIHREFRKQEIPGQTATSKPGFPDSVKINYVHNCCFGWFNITTGVILFQGQSGDGFPLRAGADQTMTSPAKCVPAKLARTHFCSDKNSKTDKRFFSKKCRRGC